MNAIATRDARGERTDGVYDGVYDGPERIGLADETPTAAVSMTAKEKFLARRAEMKAKRDREQAAWSAEQWVLDLPSDFTPEQWLDYQAAKDAPFSELVELLAETTAVDDAADGLGENLIVALETGRCPANRVRWALHIGAILAGMAGISR